MSATLHPDPIDQLFEANPPRPSIFARPVPRGVFRINPEEFQAAVDEAVLRRRGEWKRRSGLVVPSGEDVRRLS